MVASVMVVFGGDSLRYILYLTGGQIKIDICHLSYLSKLSSNPVQTYPIVINNLSGQAPTCLDHLLGVKSSHEMSTHEIKLV